MTRRVGLAIVFGAIAVITLTANAAAVRQNSDDIRAIATLLDAVDRGDRVSLAFEWDNQFDLVFRKGATAWVQAGVPADRERRERVVAIAVLLAANDAIESPPAWLQISEIVEWQCDRLRHGAPTEFEHVWMLASIAIIEGARDLSFLGSSDSNRCQNGNPSSRPAKKLTACNQAGHARSRFPDDPHFTLAGLMSRAELNVYGREPGMLRKPITLLLWPQGGVRPAEALKRVADTESRLRGLIQDPAVGAEAGLELGVLLYNLGEVDRSLIELASAGSRSRDAYVRQLAWFTTGLALDARGQQPQAFEAYEQAVRAEPSVRSTALWLGAKYFAAGRHDDAFDLVDQAFDDPNPATDPWTRRHDYRLWPSYLSRLQEFVRK